MKQRYVTCEFCDGHGEIFYPMYQDTFTCQACEGKGKLPDYDYNEDEDQEGDDNAD